MTPDSNLIQQAQQGNTDAFEQLMRRYQEQIFRISRSIVKNSQDAEDIVQDTFLQAYLKLDQLRQPDGFFSWLQKIAINLSKNHKSRSLPEGIAFEELPEDYRMLTTPEDIILRKELIDGIIESIEMLPVKDRKIIKARMNGLDHKSISDSLGISYQASMSRLSHARKKLYKHINRFMYALFGFSFDFFKKHISGGILAMKIGTTTKVIVVTVGALIILSAGYVSYNKLIMSSSSQSENETNSISDVSQGKSVATQDSKGQQNLSKTSVLESSAEHQKTVHISSDKNANQSSNENISAEKNRTSQANVSAQGGSGQTKSYDVRYDGLVETAKIIEPIAQEIKTVIDEYNRLRNEDGGIRKDPKNLNAEDKYRFASLMEKQANLNVELSNLYSSIETLVPGSLRTKDEGITLSPEGDQLEEPAPGSLRTEAEGTRRGTITTASIDYDHIRSVLGSVPAQQETYLSNLFSSLPEVYYINSVGSK